MSETHKECFNRKLHHLIAIVTVLLLGLSFNAFGSTNQQVKAECQRTAAYKVSGIGVTPDEMDTNAAIEVCRAALKMNPDDADVMAWLSRALHIAWVFDNSNGLIDEALELANRSAAGGSAEGKFKLGSFYERGDGVPQNRKRALEMYQASAADSYPKAISFLLDIHTQPDLGFADLIDLSDLQPLALQLFDVGDSNHKRKAINVLISMELYDLLSLTHDFEIEKALTKYDAAKDWVKKLPVGDQTGPTDYIADTASLLFVVKGQEEGMTDAGLASARRIIAWTKGAGVETTELPVLFRRSMEQLAKLQSNGNVGQQSYADIALSKIALAFQARSIVFQERMYASKTADELRKAVDDQLETLKHQRFIVSLNDSESRETDLAKLDDFVEQIRKSSQGWIEDIETASQNENRQRKLAVLLDETITLHADLDRSRSEHPTVELIKRMKALLVRATEAQRWREAEDFDYVESVELGYRILVMRRLWPALDVLNDRLRSGADIPELDLRDAQHAFAFVRDHVEDSSLETAPMTILRAEARFAATSGDASVAASKYEAFYRQRLAEKGPRKSPTPSGADDGGGDKGLDVRYRELFDQAAAIAAKRGASDRQRVAMILDLVKQFDESELATLIDDVTYSRDPAGDVAAVIDGSLLDKTVTEHSPRLSTLAEILFLHADKPSDLVAMRTVADLMHNEFVYFPEEALRNAWDRILNASYARLNALGARSLAAYLSQDKAAFLRNFQAMAELSATLHDTDHAVIGAFAEWRNAVSSEQKQPDLKLHEFAAQARQYTATSRKFAQKISDLADADLQESDSSSMSEQARSRDVEAKLAAVKRIGRIPITEVELDLFFVEHRIAWEAGNLVLANTISKAAADYFQSPPEVIDAANAAHHLVNLAKGHAALGSYEKAFETYEDALSVLSANGRTATPQYESISVNLLAFAARSGNREAVARSIAEYEGRFTSLLADVSDQDGPGGGARIFMTRGMIAIAEALEREATIVPQPMFTHPSTDILMSLLHQTAELEATAGNLEAARAAIALSRFIDAQTVTTNEDLDIRQTEARLAYLDGNPDEAARLQEALIASLFEQNLVDEGRETIALAAANFRLARYLRASGRYSRATETIERATAMAAEKLGDENPVLATFLFEQASLLSEINQETEALGFLARAFQLLHEPETGFLHRNFWSFGINNSLTPIKVAGTYLDALWRRYQTSGRHADVETAFAALQGLANREASEAILDAVSRKSGLSPELVRLVRQRQDILRQLSSLRAELVGAKAGVGNQFKFSRLEKLKSDFAAVSNSIADHDASLGRTTHRSVSPLNEVQSKLSKNEAVVLIRDVGVSTHIILVTNEDVYWHRTDVAGDALSQRVAKLRQTLLPSAFAIRGVSAISGDRSGKFAELSANLYQTMLEPLLSQLDGIEHLIVSANAPLDALPFQVLMTNTLDQSNRNRMKFERQRWLLEDFAVTVVPVLANFRADGVGTSGSASKPFFGVGAPKFDMSDKIAEVSQAATGLSDFRSLFRSGAANVSAIANLLPLPEAEFEVRSLARSLGGDNEDLLFGVNARESEIRARRLTDYRVLAFATHGLLAGELGALAEPALVFSPGSGSSDDDGLLTMSEVAQLSLNADWVLLSACNTAGDNGQPGSDAFSGLAQAFLYAGAKNIIVSHWPVNSEAAVSLTTGMAEVLENTPGTTLAEAMRQSMLAVIQDGNIDPAYWAPFSVVSSGSEIRP